MTFDSGQIPEWVQQFYDVDQDAVDKGIDVLFNHIDDAFLAGEFEYVNNILEQLDLERLCISLVLAVLTITKAARPHLPYQVEFTRRARARLEVLAPDRIEGLMRGLE